MKELFQASTRFKRPRLKYLGLSFNAVLNYFAFKRPRLKQGELSSMDA